MRRSQFWLAMPFQCGENMGALAFGKKFCPTGVLRIFLIYFETISHFRARLCS